MRYFDYPQAEVQRKPLVPNKLISGMLPGATEIRIGGNENIKISGKDQTISVSDGNTSVSLGRDGTTLGFGFTDATGTKRLHAGVYPDNSVKIKLSQLSKDVLTATDDQLIWSSDFNLFKIVQTNTESITLTNIANVVSAGKQTTTIAHNLGYKPSFLVYCETPADSIDGEQLVTLPHTQFVGDAPGGGPFAYFYAKVDDNNLYIAFNHGFNTDYSPSVPTFSIRYYLLRETAI